MVNPPGANMAATTKEVSQSLCKFFSSLCPKKIISKGAAKGPLTSKADVAESCLTPADGDLLNNNHTKSRMPPATNGEGMAFFSGEINETEVIKDAAADEFVQEIKGNKIEMTNDSMS
jgi:hypothetical protein